MTPTTRANPSHNPPHTCMSKRIYIYIYMGISFSVREPNQSRCNTKSESAHMRSSYNTYISIPSTCCSVGIWIYLNHDEKHHHMCILCVCVCCVCALLSAAEPAKYFSRLYTNRDHVPRVFGWLRGNGAARRARCGHAAIGN